MSTFTITGTPVVGGSGDPARRSLQNVRRIIARALHSLTLVTTTAANAGGYSIRATRLSTAQNADRYKGAWVMPVEGDRAGEVRRVKVNDALNESTGELMVAPAFSGQIDSGIDVEIHRLLPPDDDDGWTGLRWCINTALREMWVPDRLAIAGVDGQPSYNLSAYADWLDPQAVLELRRQALDGALNPVAGGSFSPVRDADALTLQVAPTLPGGDASTLEVFRESSTWIKLGGVWAVSSVGLVNDSDEHLHHPDLVAAVALVHAYEALSAGPDGARYDTLAQRQRLKANLLKLSMLDHRQRRTGSGLTSGSGGYDAKSFDAMRYR